VESEKIQCNPKNGLVEQSGVNRKRDGQTINWIIGTRNGPGVHNHDIVIAKIDEDYQLQKSLRMMVGKNFPSDYFPAKRKKGCHHSD